MNHDIFGGLSGLTKRHKVFVSYHHANDQYYRNRFEQLFSSTYDIMVSKSVQIGDPNSLCKCTTDHNPPINMTF